MTRSTFSWLGVLVCLFCVPTALDAAQFAGRELVPPQPAADFTLKSSDGADFHLSRQRGDVVVLSFVYSFCPDVCPTTLVDMSQVRALLGEAADRVRFAFITLDPKRDTPERFRTYVKAFDTSFVALLGSPEQLAQIRQAYGVIAEKQKVSGTSAAYLVAHSAYSYVIDPQGRLRLLLPFGMSVETMAADIKALVGG